MIAKVSSGKMKGMIIMALIQCPECGKEISDLARTCPNCGYPIAPVRHERTEKPFHGKYARPSNKEKWILPVTLGLFMVCVIGVIVCVSVQKNKLEPSQKEITVESSAAQENDDILLTSESLNPYLDVLGIEAKNDNSFEVATEFVEGLSSVYIMGRTGTVGHGFTADSGVTIDLMEWVDNSSATRAEFDNFINRLREYFGKDEEAVKSYDNISEETYLWIDASYNAYVLCWYKSGKINMRWDYQKSMNIGATASREETQKVNRCIRCGEVIGSEEYLLCKSCWATPIDEITGPVQKKDNQKTNICNHDWRGSTEAGFIICHKCNAVLSSDDIKAKKGTNLSSVEKAKIYWALDSNLTTRKSDGAYLYSEDEAFSLVEKEYGVTREYLKNNIWNGHARDDYVKYYITAWK